MAEDYIHKLRQLAAEVAAADTAEAAIAIDTLQVSRDFFDGEWTYEEQDAIGENFRADFNAVATEIASIWGEPDYRGQPQRSPFPSLPGGHEIAYWLHDGCLLGVFWDHQDKELPYTLELIACGPAAMKRFARRELE